MVTIHFDKFNDAINKHSAEASAAEHESVLYHEERLYELAKEHIAYSDNYDPHTFERSIAYMLYHVNVILAYTEAEITPECVVYELLDFQSTALAA